MYKMAGGHFPMGVSDESDGFGAEDVPQVQADPAQARGAGDLHGPAPQAAPGLRTRVSRDERAVCRGDGFEAARLRGRGWLIWLVSQASTFRRNSTRRSALWRSSAAAARARAILDAVRVPY